MNVDADALSRNPIDENKKESKYLQVDDNDTFMTCQNKMFSKKTFTKNIQRNSKNEVKPLKQRNLNPEIVPDNVDRFSEISKAQILNVDSKIPEFFVEFFSEESFSDIGKNILKYTNLFKNMASRFIFMKICLLSPMFSKKYENLSWKTITTRAQKKIQEEARNINQNSRKVRRKFFF